MPETPEHTDGTPEAVPVQDAAYRNSIADDALNKILAKEQSPSAPHNSIADDALEKILAQLPSIPETEESESD